MDGVRGESFHTEDGARGTGSQAILSATDLPPKVLSRAGSFSIARPPGMEPSGTLFVAIFCCLFSPLLFGYSMGFTSPAQTTMLGEADGSPVPKDLVVFSSTTQASAFASIMTIGCMLGAFMAGPISDSYGRTKALAVSCLPMMIGYPLLYVCRNWMMLTLVRLLMGLGVGIGSAVAPCYIGEVSTLELRGALGAMNQLAVTIGILGANVFGTFVFVEGDDGEFCVWPNMALLGFAFATCVLSTLFIPESPRFYASKGNLRDTRASLMKLRKVTDSFDDELMEIVNQSPALARAVQMEATRTASVASTGSDPIDANRASSMQDARLGAQEQIQAVPLGIYRKSFIAGIGMLVFQQLSGCNAIIFYVSPICKTAGMGSAANLAGTLAMLAQVVVTLIACIIMEKRSRRFFLFLSLSICTLAHVALAGYFYASAHGHEPHAAFALMAITLYIIGFSLGLGPIPWLLLAELFPTEVRGTAASIAIGTNWGCAFLVTLGFNSLCDALGQSNSFLMFAFICFLCIIFVLLCVPETRGKNIEEVLAALNGGQGAREPQARLLSA